MDKNNPSDDHIDNSHSSSQNNSNNHEKEKENDLKQENYDNKENNKNNNEENKDNSNDKEDKEDEDEILNLFFNEINTIDKLGKVEYDNKNINMNSNQIILRLTSQTFLSPYQVLQLKHDATEEDIKQRYYKLSLLIHPDKCQNDKAPQAFQVLKDAYNEIKKVDIRDKYKEIYDDAKKIVYRRHKLKDDVTQLELYAAGNNLNLSKLEGEIEKECVNILNKKKEREEYAEKCIQANIQYERNIQSNLMDLEKEKLHQQLEWDKTRDLRVNSWKTFQSKMDSGSHTKFVVKTKKEDRNDNLTNNTIIDKQTNRINKRKKIIGTNDVDSYKQSWK